MTGMDIAENPILDFQTVEVTANLRDSTGNILEGGLFSYESGGWKEAGFTEEGIATVELLPRTYNFKMEYDGGTYLMTGMDIAENPVVDIVLE